VDLREATQDGVISSTQVPETTDWEGNQDGIHLRFCEAQLEWASVPEEQSPMKSISSRVALALAGAVVPVVLITLAVGRPDYCGPADASRPQTEATFSASAGTPTLAPRQSLVVVQVEADRPDLKVGWAAN
jgi:hypothetical protein